MCCTTNLAVLISPQSTMWIRHKKLQLKIKLGTSKSILVWSYFWLDENVVQNFSILKWKLPSSRTKLNPMADFELHDYVLIASMSTSFALLATFCLVDIVITVISKWLWLENHSKTTSHNPYVNAQLNLTLEHHVDQVTHGQRRWQDRIRLSCSGCSLDKCLCF